MPAFLFTGVFGLMYAFQTSTVSAIIVGFLLMMCLYRTRPYEVEPGSANACSTTG